MRILNLLALYLICFVNAQRERYSILLFQILNQKCKATLFTVKKHMKLVRILTMWCYIYPNHDDISSCPTVVAMLQMIKCDGRWSYSVYIFFGPFFINYEPWVNVSLQWSHIKLFIDLFAPRECHIPARVPKYVWTSWILYCVVVYYV